MTLRNFAGPALIALFTQTAAAQTTINFEGLAGMSNSPGLFVPNNAQLSTQFLGQGVRFSSSSPFIAAVHLGQGHATSGSIGVGGTTATGRLSYFDPISIAFFNPSSSVQMATTSNVSIRADKYGINAPITMNAYDVFGALLASHTVIDNNGPTLTVSAAGIQRVVVHINGTSALDDLQFGTLTPYAVSSVPEPASIVLLATGLIAVGAISKRRRS